MQKITQDIHKAKYAYGDEQTIADTMRRVVEGVYAKDPSAEAKAEALEMLLDGSILPAGRILAGAGTGKRVTLINCFVSPDIQDAMDTDPDQPGLGIMDSLKVAALTQQMGGGIGMDFSTIRPRGALVKRTGSVSSGVLPFMDMWHSMCGTIMSSGSRRGAMMGTLRVDHPDILDFIEAKRTPGRLTNFNVSVLVTDAFMEAVEKDSLWTLQFGVPQAGGDICQIPLSDPPVYVYKTLPARKLWDKIIQNTYVHAEPGVIFIDRVNQMNNLAYCEYIHCSNPCFAANTLIVTDKGAVPIEDLVGKTANVWDGQRWVQVDSFRETGRDQPMLRIELQDGAELRVTPYHGMLLEDGTKCEARDLKVGAKLMLSDVTYDGEVSEPGAYLKGFLLGDGCLSSGRPRPALYLYEPKFGCRERLIESAKEIPRGAKNTNAIVELGFLPQECEQYTRKAMTGLAPLKEEVLPWCKEYKDELPERVYCWDKRTKLGFLAGLLDADGCCLDTRNGFSYQLCSVSRRVLLGVQVLLKSLGVRSKVNLMKRASRTNMGILEGYTTQDCWRLSIPQAASIKFSSKVNFARVKSLADKTVTYKCKPRAGKVVSISEDGMDEIVYCCTVPETHQLSLAVGILIRQCGEQMLPANGDCNLGHLNLAVMVKDPFTPQAALDTPRLTRAARVLVRFLDNVLDVAQFPTEAQHQEAMNKRRLGIGYTGLANALAMLGIRYGSPEAVQLVGEIGKLIRDNVYQASANLASERGSFILYDDWKFLGSEFIQELPHDIKLSIHTNGVRNGVLMSLAPTGTVSILAGNVSSGLEPVFLNEYQRKVLRDDGGYDEYIVYDYGVQKYRELHPEGPLPDYFVTSADLTVDEHLAMQAAAQKYVDASISKTINCPESMGYEEFREVYTKAWKLGLKGVTTYRPDPRSGRGSVLSEPNKDSAAGNLLSAPEKVPMLDVAEATRYRIKWPNYDESFYVTITNYVDEHGQRRPFELFINSKNAQHDEWTTALSVLITALFRRGGDSSFITEELRSVHAISGGRFMPGGVYAGSLVAAIGLKIEEHMRGLGLIQNREPTTLRVDPPGPVQGERCPKCQAPALVHEEGCRKCKACGASDCG